MYGPIVAEFSHGGAPWHAHHIAERYGLIVIIALGEGLIGTMATLGALVGPEGPGWSLDIAVLGLSGTALTFGMWWTYFIVPWGEILAAYRARSFGWGYGHIALFAAIVAVGAGLHVAASAIEHHCVLSLPKTLLCVAIPVGAYIALLYILYSVLTRAYDPFHTLLLLLSVLPLGGSVVLACTGIGLPWCIVALAVTPWISVVGYELRGHRYNEHVVDVAHNQPSAR
jgi:low temperature requirement protein LtrA